MRVTAICAGVIGSLIGLLLSLRLFLNGFLNVVGGSDLGVQTMIWSGLLAALYFIVLLGCVVLAVLSAVRRDRVAYWSSLAGVCLLAAAFAAVVLCLPLIPPVFVNSTRVVLHFASPLVGVPFLGVGALFMFLAETLAVDPADVSRG